MRNLGTNICLGIRIVFKNTKKKKGLNIKEQDLFAFYKNKVRQLS